MRVSSSDVETLQWNDRKAAVAVIQAATCIVLQAGPIASISRDAAVDFEL